MNGEGKELALVSVQDRAAQVFATIQKAMDDGADVEKMERLLTMQERIMDRQAELACSAAIMAARERFPVFTKDKRIIHPGKDGKADRLIGRYSTWDTIYSKVREPLRENGLELSFYGPDQPDKGGITLGCMVNHLEGHEKRWGLMFFPLDTTGAKSGPQAAGSSISYAKRYAFGAAFNVTFDEVDNDAVTDAAQELAEKSSELVAQSELAASRGSKAYESYFMSLSPSQKGLLHDSGKHDELKKLAASATA